MVDALVSTVLEQLTSIAISKVEEEVRLVVGVKKDVKKLTSNLKAIQKVLADAEERELKEPDVKLWLDELKDVSYDIDDVLDEWQTAILKSQIEGGNKYGSKPRWKVCSFIGSFCFCFREASLREVSLRHDIASKIKELNETLDDIAEQKSRYNFDSKRGSQQVQRLVTTSLVNLEEVKGRESEKDDIMEVLLSDSSDKENPEIISLVGMGGIGKTTLAKLLYNDNLVKTHFSERIWVCVSDPFEEVKIAKAILEHLDSSVARNLAELETISRHIKKSIEGKKFLLVLDDVWDEEGQKWELLKSCLLCGLPGSKILVTTRKVNVARVMGCSDSNIFQIGGLSSDQCWSMFSQIVFSNVSWNMSNKERKQLEDIGKKIVEKCKGLPLAIKTIGSHLRFKTSKKEWEDVLGSEIWKLGESKQKLFAPLMFSYYDLSPELRQCFLYCVVFPKDYVMEKNALIRLWMAQGYLSTTKNEEMELISEEYFKILAARSFFQDFEKFYNYWGENVTTFKIHDIVHDFAQILTKNNCLSLEFNNSEMSTLNMHHLLKCIRHLGVNLYTESNEYLYGFKKLRSLLFLPTNYDAKISLNNLINQLTCLRSLDLSGCDIKVIPPTINRLIHLRQLDLDNNSKLKELPKIICELYNLQSLGINNCNSLKMLPQDVGKLINLRHLRNSCGSAVPQILPKGVGKLSCLRTLERIDVAHNDNSEEAFSLGDLKNLKYLQGFIQINGLGKVRDHVKEVKHAKLLKEKRNMSSCLFSFHEKDEEWRKAGDEEILEALEPCPNLEILKMWHYRGLSLTISSIPYNIKQLELIRFVNVEQLPCLGELPSLEILRIRGMESVKKVGVEFLGSTTTLEEADLAFPKLTTLSFLWMEEWVEWDIATATVNFTIMPSLRSLEIFQCPKLKAIPRHILENKTLEELTIIGSPFLKERYEKEKGEEWPIISHIRDVHISDRGRYG